MRMKQFGSQQKKQCSDPVYDAIIIGGGLGGLSAGAILSRQGKRVLLLEQHYIPGGCATTFKRKDFIMEVGLHAMDGHLISQNSERSVLRYLGVHRKVRFEPIPEFFRIHSDRFDFVFPMGTKQAKRSLMEAFPTEEQGIRKFFRLIMGVQQEVARMPKEKWRYVVLMPLFPILYPNTFRSARMTVGRCLDRLVESENLKLILQGNLLYYHDDPYSMSMLFFAKAQASFIQHGGYFIHGGSQKLSDALARVIRDNGGTLLLGKHVEKILTARGRATGVSYRDTFNRSCGTTEVSAPHIIYSGALPLVPSLLPEGAGKKITRRIGDLQPACSLFCVYLGFNKTLEEIHSRHYSTFFFSNDVTGLHKVHRNNYGDWNTRSFAFVDYSRLDSGLTAENKGFGVICCADKISDWENLDETAYLEKKEEVSQILLARLENVFPGIGSLIEYREAGTPLTIRRYTLNPFGAPYGFAQIRGQAGNRRPSYKSPVKNLWFSGTWTFPGGGFTGALISGFLCGLQVNKHLGEKSREIPKFPETVTGDERIVKFLYRKEVAMNTMELTIQKPEGFTYLPGQYAIVQLNSPGITDLDLPFRSLSIASHPDEDVLRFIMRKSNSAFKRSCAALEQGDPVTIFGPAGTFTLMEKKKGIVFLVSGIGISPVIPMLRELEKTKYRYPVILFSSNRTTRSSPYITQLKYRDLENYRFIPVNSGSEGRLNKRRILRELEDPSQYEYYIIGAKDFITSMTGALKQLDVSAAVINSDNFG